jgi:ABC-type Fe3+ transport system permease subunit
MTVCVLYSLHRLYDCKLSDDAGIRELIESIGTLETLGVRYVTFNYYIVQGVSRAQTLRAAAALCLCLLMTFTLCTCTHTHPA